MLIQVVSKSVARSALTDPKPARLRHRGVHCRACAPSALSRGPWCGVTLAGSSTNETAHIAASWAMPRSGSGSPSARCSSASAIASTWPGSWRPVSRGGRYVAHQSSFREVVSARYCVGRAWPRSRSASAPAAGVIRARDRPLRTGRRHVLATACAGPRSPRTSHLVARSFDQSPQVSSKPGAIRSRRIHKPAREAQRDEPELAQYSHAGARCCDKAVAPPACGLTTGTARRPLAPRDCEDERT
jgi:hypothetical protein